MTVGHSYPTWGTSTLPSPFLVHLYSWTIFIDASKQHLHGTTSCLTTQLRSSTMSTSTAVMIYHNLKNHLSQHLNSRALLPIVTGSILILFALRLYRALASPLRDVPGPFLARFTRLWKLYTIYSGRFEQINILLHKKYGNKNGLRQRKVVCLGREMGH